MARYSRWGPWSYLRAGGAETFEQVSVALSSHRLLVRTWRTCSVCFLCFKPQPDAVGHGRGGLGWEHGEEVPWEGFSAVGLSVGSRTKPGWGWGIGLGPSGPYWEPEPLTACALRPPDQPHPGGFRQRQDAPQPQLVALRQADPDPLQRLAPHLRRHDQDLPAGEEPRGAAGGEGNVRGVEQ